MSKRLELAGRRFGRLTVLRYAGRTNNRVSIWLCACDCGNQSLVIGAKLQIGTTRSCGCLRAENSRQSDIAGQSFGRLTAINRVANNRHGQARWRCQCVCGNRLDVVGSSLRNGHTTSCGCFRHEKRVDMKRTHGEFATPLYRVWMGIKARCRNPNSRTYPDYGGRGITVCEEWIDDYVAFRDWSLAKGYAPGLQIQRIDNDGNYEPDNCMWADGPSQMRRTRGNRAVIRSDGRRFATIVEAAAATPGSHPSGIGGVCRGHGKSSAGFGWRYAPDEPPTA